MNTQLKSYDVIITLFGMFTINYEKDGISYSKVLLGGKYVTPNDEEREKLNSIFGKTFNDFCCRETLSDNPLNQSLESIVQNNPDLTNNPGLFEMLKAIEALIPLNARTNFYRNLSTLTIEFNNSNDKETGHYDSYGNKLYLNNRETNEKVFKRTLKREEIDDQTFAYYNNATIFHELLHMASSYFDQQSQTAHTGFSSIKINNRIIDGTRAFNEGFTEALTLMYYPDLIKITGYLEEITIAGYIANIVGREFAIENYFSVSGINVIKDKLKEYLSVDAIDNLFTRIEINYLARADKNKLIHANTLSNIEQTLLECSLIKIKQEINKGTFSSEEELEKYISINVMPNLIYGGKLKLFGLKTEECLDMNLVDMKLLNMQGELKELLKQHLSQTNNTPNDNLMSNL